MEPLLCATVFCALYASYQHGSCFASLMLPSCSIVRYVFSCLFGGVGIGAAMKRMTYVYWWLVWMWRVYDVLGLWLGSWPYQDSNSKTCGRDKEQNQRRRHRLEDVAVKASTAHPAGCSGADERVFLQGRVQSRFGDERMRELNASSGSCLYRLSRASPIGPLWESKCFLWAWDCNVAHRC